MDCERCKWFVRGGEPDDDGCRCPKVQVWCPLDRDEDEDGGDE